MLRLNNSVPANWIAAAHQSARSGREAPVFGGRRPLRSSWISAASVKKTAPAKNVAFVATAPTVSE